MLKTISAIVLIAALAGCSAQQLSTAQSDVQTACSTLNSASALLTPAEVVLPQIAGVLVYANAACGTEEAVAGMIEKAKSDPTTVAWINQLTSFLKLHKL